MAEARVSDDFVQQPSNEATAAGEEINWDALEGTENPGGVVNAYASPEEQGMEMVSKTFGPPQYGSPDPVTAASRLVTLEDGHPLDPGLLPEGHPAAISDDYAAEVVDEDEAEEEGDVNATAGAVELAAEQGVDLSEVEGTGADGRITKGDVEDFIDARDNS